MLIGVRLDVTEPECTYVLWPVIASTALAKDEIVWTEEGTEGSWAERICGTGLEIDQDGTRDRLVRPDFVIIDVNSFKLEFFGSPVDTIALDAVFVGYGHARLGTYRKRV